VEPIRYVESVGGYSIAYQVVGDGPLDIVFVHGWICSFQPGWEWPALASFYGRLAGMGRLILFDKRGTGLSDRVLGIASLEERMDDVRAVLDAVGAERAAVVGVSEGGPMCTLFAATHPDRTAALITLGAYARRNWAPDYPIGRRAEQDGWLRPTAEQWGRYAAQRFLEERAPSIAGDDEAIAWYSSYLVRGASPSAVAAITDMNEEIDVRHVLPTVRVPALVMYREDEYLREASRYMGERLPGAQVVGVPGADHLPWEGDQTAVLDEIERFLGEVGDAAPEPGAILTTVLELDLPEAEPGLAQSALIRFRGRALEAPEGRIRASFDGPARAVRCASALAGVVPSLRAGVHTGACELRGGQLTGAALEVAAGVAGAAGPGEILATSTVQDLVAGSGIEFAEHGTVTLPFNGGTGEWRLFSVFPT
jgi:pimeloyl-ACP methyl ester carboxylesterase